MKPRIGIVISTTREGRFGDRPATWIHELLERRNDLVGEIIDLKDYPMPWFAEAASPIYAKPVDPGAQSWNAKIGAMDGLVIVTAEYNRAPPAALKNALDHGYAEYNRKPVAFVGYGGVGGARAVEQLRLICIELQMAPTRAGVHITGRDFVALMKGKKDFSEFPHLETSADALLDDLSWWAHTLKAARGPRTTVGA